MPIYKNKDGSFSQTPKGPDSEYIEDTGADKAFYALRDTGQKLKQALTPSPDTVDRLANPVPVPAGVKNVPATIAKNPLATLNLTSGPVAQAFREMPGNVTVGDTARELYELGRGVVSEFGFDVSPGRYVRGNPPPPPSASPPGREVNLTTLGANNLANSSALAPGVAFLRDAGVPQAVQTADTSRFDNRATGQNARRAALREFQASPEFTNLGNFGTEGGPNIYGRAGVGSPTINEFVGVGTGQPAGPVNNGIGTPELRERANQISARWAQGTRADGRQFGGGAASGGGILRQVNAINQRAQTAFDNALKDGKTTTAATRIADNIRQQADQLIAADRGVVDRANITSNSEQARLREQGLDRRAAAELQANEFQRVQDNVQQELDLTFSEQDDEGNFRVNPQEQARFLRFVGGKDALVEQMLRTGTSVSDAVLNAQKLLDNLNQSPAYRDQNLRLDDLPRIFEGREAGLFEFIFNPNVDISDSLLGRQVLRDPSTGIVTAEDKALRGVRQTTDERAARIRRLEQGN